MQIRKFIFPAETLTVQFSTGLKLLKINRNEKKHFTAYRYMKRSALGQCNINRDENCRGEVEADWMDTDSFLAEDLTFVNFTLKTNINIFLSS
jgi:hypothetical protein